MRQRDWLQAVVLLPILILALQTTGLAAATAGVTLLPDRTVSPPVRHGLSKLSAALEAHGISVQEVTSLQQAEGDILIAAGLTHGSGAAAELLRSQSASPPQAAESLLIRHMRWNGKETLLVAGADARGLMYALLDTARRISWSSNPRRPLSEVRDTTETPAVAERALSIYTMNRAHFESFFFNEDYWARYLDMLAENRFNSLALLFAYENAGYFSPAYPYFFDVKGYPNVHVVGWTKKQQRQHTQALRKLIRMTHDRGLNFTLGLWDHIYRGGVQSGGMDVKPGEEIPGVVVGLTQDNLMAFSKVALRQFLEMFPDVDAVQFRMHGESGLKHGEMHEFWGTMYDTMKKYAPQMRFYARAKGFPDSLIDLALEKGVNITVATKYWAEQMGMPFHPSHINRQNQFDRRHGYADLLRYPKKHDMHWRLWNGGTARILLWGDPDYVRRFVESTHLYDGSGYEVNEPLATKMASQPHDMQPFQLLAPQYQHYTYEFERYWHFFQLFGRLGYNPKTSPEVWRQEFRRRFGPEAAPHIQRALHRASRILPMINAYNFPYGQFPTTRGWAEKERREDLPDYAAAEGSDLQQFLSMKEAAQYRLQGRTPARITPEESSQWFAQISRDIFRELKLAEKRIGRHKSVEFDSTAVDVRILANLALYHSRRARAGLSYALWQETGDLNAFDDAIRQEGEAIQAWEALVEAAGDVYAENLRMGLASAGLSGHWKDELAALKKGLRELKKEREAFQPPLKQVMPLIAHVPVRRAAPGKDLLLRATISGEFPIVQARIVYRGGHTHGDGDTPHFHSATLKQTRPFLFSGAIPASAVTSGLKYFLEVQDGAGHWVSYPRQGRLRPVEVAVSEDKEAPWVGHTPIARAPAEKPLRITVQVRDPSGVRWVRLRYRSVNQHHDYQALPMLPSGKKDEYAALIPAEHVVSRWDFMYLIEAADRAGNGRIYPDLYEETPYIVVRLQR